jgi:predicted nucleic acid-binding protein
MIYLLATQTILDILAGRPQIQKWLQTVPLHSVEISTVSIAQSLHKIRSSAAAAQRRAYERALTNFRSAMQIHQGVVGFDDAAAEIWPTLMEMDLQCEVGGKPASLGAASRMVVATALAREAVLVEQRQPYHHHVPGLQVQGFE